MGMGMAVVPVIVIVVLFAAAYWVQNQWRIKSNPYWAIFWGVMWLLASFWFAYLCTDGLPEVKGGPGKDLLFAWFLLSGVAGGAAGWLLGVFFFPVDTSEAQVFNKVETMVGSLVGGFLLSYITGILKYLTDHDPGKPPLILTAGYRECIGFFFVSLLVSGGVQVAIRNLAEVRISWVGPDPELTKDGSFQLNRGHDYQLIGAALGSPKLSVLWRLEAEDAVKLKALMDGQLITLSNDGKLSIKGDDAWSAGDKSTDFNFDIIATAVGRPELAKSMAVVIKKAAAAGTPVITQVNPNSGQQGVSNLPVTITGNFTNFTNASVVTFSGAGVTAGAPTAATATSVTVPVTITGAAAIGARDVTVTTGAEVVTLTSGFTV